MLAIHVGILRMCEKRSAQTICCLRDTKSGMHFAREVAFAICFLLGNFSVLKAQELSASSERRGEDLREFIAHEPSTLADYKPGHQLDTIQKRLGQEFDRPLRFASSATNQLQIGDNAGADSGVVQDSLPSVSVIDPSAENFPVALSDSPDSVVLHSKRNKRFGEFRSDMGNLPRVIQRDYANYLSRESVLGLTLGLGVGAAIANSRADSEMFRGYQSWARDPDQRTTSDAIHSTKVFGEGKVMLPIYVGTWGASYLFDSPALLEPMGEWGSKSVRGFLVGAPSLMAFQWITGASRPWETTHGSEWKFLADNNGVSGHGFMGALPFLTAAKMSDRVAIKTLCFAGSTLTPLSRINDSDHFPSQAILGWWFAYLAATAVDVTDHPDRKWRVFPIANATESGMAAEFKW
jgi:hypothetical protein